MPFPIPGKFESKTPKMKGNGSKQVGKKMPKEGPKMKGGKC